MKTKWMVRATALGMVACVSFWLICLLHVGLYCYYTSARNKTDPFLGSEEYLGQIQHIKVITRMPPKDIFDHRDIISQIKTERGLFSVLSAVSASFGDKVFRKPERNGIHWTQYMYSDNRRLGELVWQQAE